MAGLRRDGRLISDVSQVRAAMARSKARGRVAIIIVDNLKTHTAQGSLLVRRMLTELSDQLYLVYTPAYDPDANRIEWLWRISRRVVTHNHQRRDAGDAARLPSERTLRSLLSLLMTCFVISAVLLHQISDPIDHKQLQHDLLEARQHVAI